jgi:hypothetical protein
MILKATQCNILPESLRPSIKPIFEIVNINTNSISNGGTQMKREMKWFVFGLAIIMAMFAMTIFQDTTEDLTEVAILESQKHFEEAQKAVSDNNLELALIHLDAIHERTPAWFESRELHWQVKEDLNSMYAKQTEAKAVQ